MSQKLESKRVRRGFNNTSNDTTDENIPSSSLVTKLSFLEKDLERRQESYIARERAYKTRIQELEEELLFVRQTKTGWMKSDGKMSKLKSMQGQIMKNVELVQDRTSRVLQEQERDLLRAFRARLFDVQSELEKEKSKKEDGAGAWIERSRKLESEVEWAKEVADRLERVNQTLLTENSRLKSQFNSQEEDRNFLIAQLVGVKKENAQLKAEYGSIGTENDSLKNVIKKTEEDMKFGAGGNNATGNSGNGPVGTWHGSSHRDSGAKAHNGTGDNSNIDERYKEINARLRRLLSEERKALQHVRTNYAVELRSRTEMEMLLRLCVEDVRKEISLRNFVTHSSISRIGSRPGTSSGTPTALPPTSSFTQADRERTLELLLSQERVISLIYAKTFPINQTNKLKNSGCLGSALDYNNSNDNVVDNDILHAISLGISNNNNTYGSQYKQRDNTEAAILHSISVGLSNNANNAQHKTREEEYREYDPHSLSISEGGGGPLILAALSEHSSNKLPAIQ